MCTALLLVPAVMGWGATLSAARNSNTKECTTRAETGLGVVDLKRCLYWMEVDGNDAAYVVRINIRYFDRTAATFPFSLLVGVLGKRKKEQEEHWEEERTNPEM